MSNDPLLQRIKAENARIEADRFNRGKKQAQTTVNKIQKDMTAMRVFFAQVLLALLWIYNKILARIGRALKRPCLWCFLQYRKLWSKVVHVKDEFGNVRFSKVRGGLMILATVGFFYIIPTMLGLVWDSALYLATAEVNEPIALTRSQEIYPDVNVHMAQGCYALPCSDRNSVYFRIHPSLFNHLWALFHTGNIFFPDFVAAAIPPEANNCTATSYGFRWKFLVRNWDIYPELLAAKCEPVEGKLR